MANKSKDPLEGKTLEKIIIELHAAYGWQGLAKKIAVNCFAYDPSIKSSLTFLRKTPWARTKVEKLYLSFLKQKEKESPESRTSANPQETEPIG